MPTIRKFPFILVDSSGDIFGIDSEEQARLYSAKDDHTVYDAERGTAFGIGYSLTEADELEDDEDNEDEDEG